jgi:2,3-bisphosphoglycerate-independent phosphoglycerate mutase
MEYYPLMATSNRPRPVVLTIMDGWGENPNPKNNAVAMARTPNFDRLRREYPHTLIRTDGPFVGLPEGQMGNSEVGHLNIGAGRIVKMDVTRIDDMIAGGEFSSHYVLQAAMAHGRSRSLHLLGLVSPGGVHSHTNHLYALLEMAKQEGVERVYVHCFTDGRDVPPESGAGYIGELAAKMEQIGIGRIATISGRYYAMDRDRRWERVERAFRAMVLGEGKQAADPVKAMRASYADGVTDEFVEPTVLVDDTGEPAGSIQPVGTIQAEDAVIFFNYRADRARQMSLALNDPELEKPARSLAPKNLHYVTMTQYERSYPFPHVLGPHRPERILGEICAENGLTNLRTAETEKYPHVTYFFNGGAEKPFEGEQREMVASPKVATYNLQPEMSAAGICDVVVNAIESEAFDLIVVNFANGDMVGHTGVIPAAIKAIETVDACLGRIHEPLKRKGGAWIVTADHGNADLLVNPETGEPHTYHTTFPVPLIVVSEFQGKLRDGGSLRDIAPTILGLLGIEPPEEMTGQDLRSAP